MGIDIAYVYLSLLYNDNQESLRSRNLSSMSRTRPSWGSVHGCVHGEWLPDAWVSAPFPAID